MPVCRNPMSGTALRMVSPSSSSMMRRTPCVEGCCGPMLRVIRRGAAGFSGSTAGACSVATESSSRGRLLIWVTVLVAVHRIILAQRVAFPVERHQDPHQIRMIAEADAEHVKHFALVPVG